MAASAAAAAELRSILYARRSQESQNRWRRWSSELMRGDRLSVPLLTSLWREVIDFDPVLAGHIASPSAVPDRTVVVAGSGKETFKTLNVSTAASLLAASAGALVVKGVSRSVSTVSGATDVLTTLGIPIGNDPAAVGPAVEKDGIEFVSYAAFCPGYAARYDGVFRVLSPLSFFMPVAMLAVAASRFLYGLAHRDVSLAAAMLCALRPALATGFAVATEIGPNEIVDESVTVGTTYTAIVDGGRIKVSRRVQAPPIEDWRRAVAHRTHHAANAHAVVDALSPHGHPARVGLVEHNAALVLIAAHDGQLTATDALAQAQEARASGRAERLLAHLQSRKDAARSCTAS